jgi:hypothetical protein
MKDAGFLNTVLELMRCSVDQINPKGGMLVKASVSHRSEDQLHKEAEKVVKSFPNITIEQAKMGLLKDIYAEIYVNDIYQVAVYRNEDADSLVHVPELKGRCTWLSIKRRDKRPVNNWQDMQTIKNRLVGVECDAIQMFPAESRMVNTANQYHLIVLPEDANVPFGWGTRFVDTDNRVAKPNGSAQSFKGEA